ncbi:uncharacterized mitochondrial protein-like protein [Tanacetum coccineum]
MVGKSVFNNEGKATGQREVRPVWNNAHRVNHQNFSNNLTHPHPRRNFVPSAVMTNSGKVPVNTAKQSFPRAAISTSTTRYVNTAASRPTVNVAKPSSNVFHKSHSPVKKTSYQRTSPKNSDLKEKVNTVKGNPQHALKDQGIVDSGCSRHITGNKAYISYYQEIDGGFIAFGGSPKGGIKNQINHRVKIIRSDNGTEFKNSEMNQFCQMKGIKREFSVARTPQQNGVAERKNRTLIEAARNMLADSLLPTIFWAEAVNTACYVQNRVLVTKPQNKTPYELLIGRSPNLDFMRSFGCPVTILNTLDHLGIFEGKTDEGFLVGYSVNKWIFDIDSLTKSMNYEPVITRNQTNDNAGIKTDVNSGQDGQKKASDHEYILLPFMPVNSPLYSSTQSSYDKDADEVPDKGDEETGIFDDVYDDREVGAEADTNNLELSTVVSHIPTTRVHKDHPKEQIIGDLNSVTQTRRMINFSKENALVSYINKQRRTNHKDYQNCLFACFLSQINPNNVIQALTGPSWIEAMQEELLQFKLQKVWTLVDLPNGKRVIGTKWVFRNKKDERGIVVYVDDIIFGSTKKSLCVEFEQMMHKRFQMSSIGELTFFLGLQVKQKDDGIFINQDKYVADILKKFDFSSVKTASTPMEPNKALIKDAESKDVDVHLYRSMIGSLMYLTDSRPDIVFVVCACARFQVTPKVSHLHAVKRIFRYLKGQSKLGLWYPRDSPFDLEAFSNSDYAGASLDRKSTTGGCQFLGKRLISWQCKKQTVVANSTTEA